MAQPRVTAIITNYNHARYVAAAIDSALAQTYPDVEVLVVDDGSTDDSRAVLGDYRDRVRLILTENRGQAAAFNVGIDAAEGKIVCLLDADDLWEPGKVQSVVDAFAAHPSASLVYHRMRLVDGGGADLGRPRHPPRLMRGDLRPIVRRSGGWWPYPPTSALSFTAELLRRVAPVPPDAFRLCADAYLADLAPFLGEVVALEAVLADYRLHDANGWNTGDRLAGDASTLERNATTYESRISSLNAKLVELEVPDSVDIADHWPLARTETLLGRGPSTLALIRTALRFPAEPRRLARVKSAATTVVERRRAGRVHR